MRVSFPQKFELAAASDVALAMPGFTSTCQTRLQPLLQPEKRTVRERSRDSRRAARVMLPCSSVPWSWLATSPTRVRNLHLHSPQTHRAEALQGRQARSLPHVAVQLRNWPQTPLGCATCVRALRGRTVRKRSRDSRRAACVMLPCSSVARGRPARPNSMRARCAPCLVRKKTMQRPPRSARAHSASSAASFSAAAAAPCVAASATVHMHGIS